jgi:hypothetical protein
MMKCWPDQKKCSERTSSEDEFKAIVDVAAKAAAAN